MYNYEIKSTGIYAGDQGKSIGSYGGQLRRLALNQIQPYTTFQQHIPFDYYCPSVEKKLTERTCEKSSLYFPSKAAKICHNKIHGKKRKERLPSPEVSSEEDLLIVSQELESDSETTTVDEPNESVENDSGVELIEDYAAWTASYFLEQ
ncbi:unnamed protein product [Rotaria sp. Silwood2]|nr:unnamed protein product [Rotaria sp. Silwood2]